MGEVALWILGVALFVVVIAASIALHEGGHMVVAKRLGVSVPRFFIGFGPTVFSKKVGETEYGVKALPLGGFVQVVDENLPEDSEDRYLLSYVAPWKRVLIYMAGPLVNIVIGVTLFVTLLLTVPVAFPTTTVGEVNTCGVAGESCVAAQGGVLQGDKLVAIDGRPVESFQDIKEWTPQEAFTLTVERQGERKNLSISKPTNGLMGITMAADVRPRTVGEASATVASVFYRSVKSLASIPERLPHVVAVAMGNEERSDETMSSVVGAGRVYGDIAATDKIDVSGKLLSFATNAAMLNLGLGFANLLPMLPLDGGRIFVALMDSVKMRWDRLRRRAYKPLRSEWVGAITVVTGAMIFCYMGILIWADIVAPVKLF